MEMRRRSDPGLCGPYTTNCGGGSISRQTTTANERTVSVRMGSFEVVIIDRGVVVTIQTQTAYFLSAVETGIVIERVSLIGRAMIFDTVTSQFHQISVHVISGLLWKPNYEPQNESQMTADDDDELEG